MNKKTTQRSGIWNKKAFAFLPIVLFGSLSFLGLYMLGFLPIPKLEKFQSATNFYILVLLWFLIQAGIFYLFFKGGTYLAKGINFIKTKVLRLSYNFEDYMITHYS
jgi:amino acid transporter